MPDMENEEYIALAGSFCPKCRTEAVNVGEFEATGCKVVARANCGHCGATWSEEFALSGFKDLTTKVLN